jgi:hypothetical protein
MCERHRRHAAQGATLFSGVVLDFYAKDIQRQPYPSSQSRFLLLPCFGAIASLIEYGAQSIVITEQLELI